MVECPPADVRQELQSRTPWRATDKSLLPISLPNFLSLLDWTGRQRHRNKRGAIPAHLAGILKRLGIRPAYSASIPPGAPSRRMSGVLHWQARGRTHLGTLPEL